MSDINTFGNEAYFNKKATFFEGVEISTGDVRVSDGTIVGNLSGNVTGDITGNITGNISGNVTGNVTGDLSGNVTGNVTGNLSGNVTGDLSGNVTGNVTGNVSGNVSGNVTGNVNSTGISTFNLLQANTLSGIATAGITTIYAKSINDYGISGYKNLLRNGDFAIDTFNVGVGVGYSGDTTQYFSDGWRSSNYVSATELRMNHRREEIGDSRQGLTELDGFRYCNRTNVILDGSILTNHTSFIQGVEQQDVEFLNWFTPSAKPVVLSFWAKGDQTGEYPVSIRTGFGGSTTSYVMSYGIGTTNTWRKYEYYIPGPGVSVGSSMSTNQFGNGLLVSFSHAWVAAGATTTVNEWIVGDFVAGVGSTSLVSQGIGAKLFITGVQLEAGTVSTEFERIPIADQLARCQRYRYGWVGSSTFNTGAIGVTQSNISATNAPFYTFLPTAMRGTPSIRVSDPAHFSVQGGGTITNIELQSSTAQFDNNGHTLRFTATGTSFNTGTAQIVRMTSTDAKFLILSEL